MIVAVKKKRNWKSLQIFLLILVVGACGAYYYKIDKENKEKQESHKVVYSKDVDAGWIKKRNQYYYGHKVHNAVTPTGFIVGGIFKFLAIFFISVNLFFNKIN